MSFADGLRAVRRRGELMATAGDVRPGAMSAVLGLDAEASWRPSCEQATATRATAKWSRPTTTTPARS